MGEDYEVSDDEALSHGLYVASGSSLWMEDCEIITTHYGITVGSCGHLSLHNCKFTGANTMQSINVDDVDQHKGEERFMRRWPSRCYDLNYQKVIIFNCLF